MESIGVEVFYLPAYFSDLNPIENVHVFGCIKQRLDEIRPRALTSLQLKAYISLVIEVLREFSNYYCPFWQKIIEIVNQIE